MYKIKENEFYIMFRTSHKRFRYSIYRTNTYGGDLFKEVNTIKEAHSLFNKVTKEANISRNEIN